MVYIFRNNGIVIRSKQTPDVGAINVDISQMDSANSLFDWPNTTEGLQMAPLPVAPATGNLSDRIIFSKLLDLS